MCEQSTPVWQTYDDDDDNVNFDDLLPNSKIVCWPQRLIIICGVVRAPAEVCSTCVDRGTEA
jgi:hypothetical protein